MRTQVPHLESPVSFVDHQGNKQWVWLALDSKTREIVGVTIGDWLCHCAERNRSEQAAPELWNSLPPVYRDFDKKLGSKRGESLIYQLFNLKTAKFLIYLGFRRFYLVEVKSPSGEAFTPF